VAAKVDPLAAPPPPLALATVLAEEPYWAWLDTAKMAGPACGYSILAAWPRALVAAKETVVRVGRPGHLQPRRADPISGLAEWFAAPSGAAPSEPGEGLTGPRFARPPTPPPSHAPPRSDFPLPFAGGLIGYWGYDLAPWMEPVVLRARDDIGVPDMYVGWYDAAVVYDHRRGEAWLVWTAGEDGAEAAALLRRALQQARGAAVPQAPARALSRPAELAGNFTYEQYLNAILRAKEYIAAGDIYQVNLSQRFAARLAVEGWSLYLRLRQTNPAPFAAYLRFGEEVEVLSSSPERFLRLEADGLVETRPIKGTISRGSTPAEDQRLARQLMDSVKDRAELLMIVDLERNDLGKVCQIGSVHVPALFSLETFETVHHLVGTVHGRLRADKTPLDLLRATFPGGSITGAPKIRAMEIIDELEPTRRAVYTGSVGYISAHGRMDLNIAIRTFIVRRGEAFYQVGGGIVADSDPAAEYQETLHKGRGLAAALAEELPQQLDALAEAARA
jgi:para-aminobenzoate synthetase component 1